MKILMICNTDGALYVFRRPIIEALLRKGVRVSTFSGASRYVDKLAAMGVAPTFVEFPRHSILPWPNLKLLIAMRRTIRSERPDIVHCFTHKAAILGSIAARTGGVKCIVLTVTGLGSVFVDNTVRNILLRLVLRFQYWIAARLSDAVFFQNPDDLHEMARWGVIPSGKARLTAGSGLDLDLFPERSWDDYLAAKRGLMAELSIVSPSLIVLFPARATAEKGVFEFYEAAKTLSETAPGKYTFLHVGLIDESGKGALTLEQLQSLAKRSGVHYLGFKEDVERYMLGADLVVLPSHREGLPRSLIEALSYGKAIITSDAPGCRETVVDGMNGYLAEVGDPKSLAACIGRVTPELIGTAASFSRNLVETKFDAKRVVEETFHSYGLQERQDEMSVL